MVIRTLSTSAILRCSAELDPGSVSSAVAVQRGLAGIAAPRAVPGAPDDGPAVCAAPCSASERALVHAGAASTYTSLIGVFEDLPRGAAQALAGPRCGARGALGAARLAGIAICIVVPELPAAVHALAGRSEVLTTVTRRTDVFLIAAGTVCYGAHYTGCSISAGLLVTVTSEALERG